jgi:hypothetical protein
VELWFRVFVKEVIVSVVSGGNGPCCLQEYGAHAKHGSVYLQVEAFVEVWLGKDRFVAHEGFKGFKCLHLLGSPMPAGGFLGEIK